MSKSKLEVLIIEDDAQIQLLMNEILLTAGFQVSSAKNIETALERLRTRTPHLILLDLILGKESGLNYLKCHHTLKLTRKIPIIVITGLKTREALTQAISLGASDYILKPFDIAGFLKKVRKAVSSREFLKVTLKGGPSSQINMKVKGTITQANETGGLILEAPIKLSETSIIKLTSPLFKKLRCEDSVCQRTSHQAILNHPENTQFLNEITLSGLSPGAIKRIKAVQKEWK